MSALLPSLDTFFHSLLITIVVREYESRKIVNLPISSKAQYFPGLLNNTRRVLGGIRIRYYEDTYTNRTVDRKYMAKAYDCHMAVTLRLLTIWFYMTLLAF